MNLWKWFSSLTRSGCYIFESCFEELSMVTWPWEWGMKISRVSEADAKNVVSKMGNFYQDERYDKVNDKICIFTTLPLCYLI